MTKKIEKEKILLAQSKLINDFVNSLTMDTKEQYRQVVNALAVDDAYTTNKTRNFIESWLKTREKQEKLDLIEALKNDKEKYNWNDNGKKSYSTYLNSFIEYLENNIDTVYNISETDIIETSKDEQIYFPSVLYTKFKSRLRCQDRTSGDKIWLPLRFIGKLYTLKDGRNKSRFSIWLDSLVDGIYVHYKDEDNNIKIIKSKCFKNGKLLLKFKVHQEEGSNDKFDVYVGIMKKSRYEEYRAYTPTGKGNKKVPMVVKSISEIDIDHIKPIDQTLRDLEKKLPELKKVSDYYKGIQEEECNENDAAKELIERINLDKLYKELKKISNDGLLRLMDSKYNSCKSNGDTFQSIMKCSKGDSIEYWGIIEKEEVILNENNQRVYLMQKMTNTLDTNENVFQVKIELPKGDEIKGSKNLEKIIDYI